MAKTGHEYKHMSIRIGTILFLLDFCLSWAATAASGPGYGIQSSVTPDPNALTEQLNVVITEVTGNSVQFSRDGGESWQRAVKEIILLPNAMVRTGFAGGCEISFRGNTIIQIEAFSSVRIADYMGNKMDTREKIDVNLHYGAVRCGVMKGRISSDTRITTPVSILGIRGTRTRVEYDRGTEQCQLAVLKDGPADAMTWEGRYRLNEGMKTDNKLSRYLKTAILDRTVFVGGSVALGDISEDEAEIISGKVGAVDPVEESFGQLPPSHESGGGNGSECTDGECDPGPAN